MVSSRAAIWTYATICVCLCAVSVCGAVFFNPGEVWTVPIHTAAASFIFQSLPVTLIAFLNLWWENAAYFYARTQAFANMATARGATAEESLLLEYDPAQVFALPYNSFKRRHWRIFFASSLALVGRALPIVLGSAIQVFENDDSKSSDLHLERPPLIAVAVWLLLYAIIAPVLCLAAKQRLLPRSYDAIADLVSWAADTLMKVTTPDFTKLDFINVHVVAEHNDDIAKQSDGKDDDHNPQSRTGGIVRRRIPVPRRKLLHINENDEKPEQARSQLHAKVKLAGYFYRMAICRDKGSGDSGPYFVGIGAETNEIEVEQFRVETRHGLSKVIPWVREGFKRYSMDDRLEYGVAAYVTMDREYAVAKFRGEEVGVQPAEFSLQDQRPDAYTASAPGEQA